MIGSLHLFALGCYAFAASLLVMSLLRGRPQFSSIATGVVAVGIGVHLGALAAFLSRWGELPLVGLGPCLSTIALLIALVSVFAATFWSARPLGLVLVPLAAFLLGGAAIVGIEPAGEPVAFRGPWFVLHVLFAFGGYAGLATAFAAGLMYLLQFRQLRSKRFGPIFRFFPPLETLDRVGQWGLLIGFPFLTLALLLGWAWTERFGATEMARNSEVIWGVLTWCVFLVALVARRGGGTQAKRTALASVLGFAVVVVTYLVLRVQSSPAGAFL